GRRLFSGPVNIVVLAHEAREVAFGFHLIGSVFCLHAKPGAQFYQATENALFPTRHAFFRTGLRRSQCCQGSAQESEKADRSQGLDSHRVSSPAAPDLISKLRSWGFYCLEEPARRRRHAAGCAKEECLR